MSEAPVLPVPVLLGEPLAHQTSVAGLTVAAPRRRICAHSEMTGLNSLRSKRQTSEAHLSARPVDMQNQHSARHLLGEGQNSSTWLYRPPDSDAAEQEGSAHSSSLWYTPGEGLRSSSPGVCACVCMSSVCGACVCTFVGVRVYVWRVCVCV